MEAEGVGRSCYLLILEYEGLSGRDGCQLVHILLLSDVRGYQI
jgi:hypothetical protein